MPKKTWMWECGRQQRTDDTHDALNDDIISKTKETSELIDITTNLTSLVDT